MKSNRPCCPRSWERKSKSSYQWEQTSGTKQEACARRTKTMTMTHSEKSDIRKMKAWPYRQEYCAGEACSFGKVCTNPLLRTVCNASSPEMASYTRKKTRDNTQAVAGMNSQIRISESSDSEQHNESDREARRETHRPGKPGKETSPEEEVADTIAHQSFLIPSNCSFFGTRNSYSIASCL